MDLTPSLKFGNGGVHFRVVAPSKFILYLVLFLCLTNRSQGKCDDDKPELRTHQTGAIVSPSYPYHYPPDKCYTWSILSHVQFGIITISFLDIDIPAEADGSCTDAIHIGTSAANMKTICGAKDSWKDNLAPWVYISEKDHLYIVFESMGEQKHGRGFSLTYFSSSSDPLTKCSPGQYKCKNGRCILEHWRCNELDECGDGSDEFGCVNATSPVDRNVPFCPSDKFSCKVNGVIKCLDLFQKCNKVVDCDSGQDETNCSSSCGGNLDIQQTANEKEPSPCSGTFQSPQYPGNYPSNVDCEWVIRVPQNHQIQLRFSEFKVQEDYGTDFLKVFDGQNEYQDVIGQFYGRNVPPKVVTSSGHAMLVVFHSDSSHNDKGFNVTYQIKGCCIGDQLPCGHGEDDCFEPNEKCDSLGIWHCPDHGGDELGCGKCSDSLYSCGHSGDVCYSERERCNGKPKCALGHADERDCSSSQCGPHNGTFLCGNKRCIEEQWQCDGTDDCLDNTDEINCAASPTLRVIIAAVVGSLICGLLLVIALGCTCKLYALRMQDQNGGPRFETPMSRLQAEFMRRQPPPTYNDAMITSRPFDEVRREYLAQMNAQNNDTSATGTALNTQNTADVNENGDPDGGPQRNGESVQSGTQEFRNLLTDSSSDESDSGPIGGTTQLSISTATGDIRARWSRNKRKSRSRDRHAQNGSHGAFLERDAGSSTADTASASIDSVIVSMNEDSRKPETETSSLSSSSSELPSVHGDTLHGAENASSVTNSDKNTDSPEMGNGCHALHRQPITAEHLIQFELTPDYPQGLLPLVTSRHGDEHFVTVSHGDDFLDTASAGNMHGNVCATQMFPDPVVNPILSETPGAEDRNSTTASNNSLNDDDNDGDDAPLLGNMH